jgi:hypothetical protein
MASLLRSAPEELLDVYRVVGAGYSGMTKQLVSEPCLALKIEKCQGTVEEFGEFCARERRWSLNRFGRDHCLSDLEDFIQN